jgi:hypothetical protein
MWTSALPDRRRIPRVFLRILLTFWNGTGHCPIFFSLIYFQHVNSWEKVAVIGLLEFHPSCGETCQIPVLDLCGSAFLSGKIARWNCCFFSSDTLHKERNFFYSRITQVFLIICQLKSFAITVDCRCCGLNYKENCI